MTWLDAMEKRFGRFAIPHLTLGIMLGQILVYFLTVVTRQISLADLMFIPPLVLEGQIHRLFTFAFQPPMAMHPVFLAFAWYLFYLMGSALEEHWGPFRYNLFLLIGYLATLAAAFADPQAMVVIPNSFWFSSVFLAFAILNPDFELRLFLILPIKIKWLAWFTVVIYALTFFTSPLQFKLVILAAVLNLGLFFGRTVIQNMRAARRRKAFHRERAAEAAAPFHRCVVCGKTDKTHPDEDFRYDDGLCFCQEHLDPAHRPPREQWVVKDEDSVTS